MPKASQHGEYLTLRSCFVPNLVHAWDSPLPVYGVVGGEQRATLRRAGSVQAEEEGDQRCVREE